MHIHMQHRPPRIRRAGELSPLATTAIAGGVTPEACEQIARAFLATAAELRAASAGEAGHA